jgi:hypothetical protein
MTKDAQINLKGSVAIVSDFFFTAINSILYQRGKFDDLFIGLLDFVSVVLTNRQQCIILQFLLCEFRNLHARNF